jgi:spindle assembly abnormal protein 6
MLLGAAVMFVGGWLGRRFQAVLSLPRGASGDSLFRIVETNDFKQLPHITLGFRPGNDASVKQVIL